MKHTKVIPLYKKAIQSDPGNYRPVSILSITSKILERVVHEQMYKYQSGFRKIHIYSTDFTRLMREISVELYCLTYRRTLIQLTTVS
jgi:hypothetical protein